MKIVINRCHGGFGLSALAVKRLAELNGRECYFFKQDVKSKIRTPINIDETDKELFFVAFDIPNPDEVIKTPSSVHWYSASDEERQAYNDLYRKHDLSTRPDDRTDPKLIQVVEELGEKANGRFAELSIVEIPDGVDWEIDEYDGAETINEKHRSWR